MLRLLAVSMAIVFLVGCADEFDPYNLITEHRLLGLRADAPTLGENETATLSALVSENDATYEWSWCPLSTGLVGSYRCAVTRDELQLAVDEFFGEGQVEIPPFELGSDPTASFTYSVPSELFAGLCQILVSEDIAEELPEGIDLPTCSDGSYEIQIKLVTESGGVQVTGVRDLSLLYADDAQRNANPSLVGVTAIDLDTGDEVELAADAPTSLVAGRTYQLLLDIPESSAEDYLEVPPGETEAVPTRETLVTTWFREGGDFDKDRTGFIDGDVDFQILLENEWTLPTLAENDGDATRLFWVLRDDRGGVDFMSRDISLEAP